MKHIRGDHKQVGERTLEVVVKIRPTNCSVTFSVPSTSCLSYASGHRFGVLRAKFIDVCETLQTKVKLLETKNDATSKIKFRTYKICTDAMQKIDYKTSSKVVNYYAEIRDSTDRFCLKTFANRAVII